MDTPFDFTAYRVAIAGGSRGIGRGIALAFLASGAQVSTCARHRDGLESLRDAGCASATNLHTTVCDLASADQTRRWITESAQQMDGLDVLVNNATGYGFDERDEDWLKGFNVDLMAAVRASRHAVPYLRCSRHASIVHVSSIASLRPRPMMTAYAAMKSAINSYTMTQALTLAKDRIRVNAIAPGSIEFEGGLWDRVRRQDRERYANQLATIPFDRFGKPADVAQVALFLASPCASWITGQTIVVDGGQTLCS